MSDQNLGPLYAQPNPYLRGTKGSDSPFAVCSVYRLQTADTAVADTGVETETPLLLFGSIGEGIAAKQIRASVAGVGSLLNPQWRPRSIQR